MTGPLAGTRDRDGRARAGAVRSHDAGGHGRRGGPPSAPRAATTTTTRSAMPPIRCYVLHRRRSVAIDLKHPDGVATVLHLVERADASSRGSAPA